MLCRLSAAVVAAVIGLGTATVEAQSQSFYSYTVDPYDVQPQPWASPVYSSPMMWQMNPYAVGYNLLSGYRPIYSGARQPVGHEIITTHANGNGYVYRPIYGPSPGYRYSVGGALIVEYPNVRYPAPIYVPPEAQPVAPSTFELPLPNAAANSVAPPPPAPSRSGPREF